MGLRLRLGDTGHVVHGQSSVSGRLLSPPPPRHSVEGCEGNFQRRFKEIGSFEVTIHTLLATIDGCKARTDE
jgi:hypothetical protein